MTERRTSTSGSGTAGDTAATSALWYVAKRECALNAVDLASPGPEDCVVRALYSGISRGTEKLVCEGRVPKGERERMRAPFQDGDFPFPVKYGYCAVGLVETGPSDLRGRTVFALHPHQQRFVLPREALVVVPDTVPARRATLAANMQTALNAHWDAGSGPCDRIVVVGGGVIGLLTAWLAARLPGADVTLIDLDPSRQALAAKLGFGFATPDKAPRDADIVFHASATSEGLATAIACAGFEARIVELSWYGEGAVSAPLGGCFHAGRLQLVSSQVGHVSASRRARFDHGRRAEAAMALLDDPRLDHLLGEDIPFPEAATRVPDHLFADSAGPSAILRY